MGWLVALGSISVAAPVAFGLLSVISRSERRTEELQSWLVDWPDRATELHEELDRRTRHRQVLETVLEGMVEGVAVVERDGRFRLVNEAAERMSGVREHAQRPDEWAAHYGAYDMNGEPLRQEDLILLKATRGEEPEPRDSYFETPSGRVYVRAHARPLRDEAGDVWGGVLILYDTTEQRAVEVEREELVADLERRNAELERFAYTVSHDLKSPLVTISGFVELLERDYESRDWERMTADMDEIAAASESMRSLLSSVLELAKVGDIASAEDEVSLGAVARGAAETVPGLGRQVGLSISAELPSVRGDRTRLQEVFQNLFENAVKFMGETEAPAVTVGVHWEGDRRVLYVEDNGVGIDPADRESVFALFHRLDPEIEGTGIGLALVKRIIESHGGRIWVADSVGESGSRFCFTLPEGEPR